MPPKSARPDPSTLIAAALDYAARGWPVFPCSPQTKQPLLGNDVDPATGEKIKGTGGLKKASTDAEAIRAWWQRWPNALIGLATGHGSGDCSRLFVLDFDPRTDSETGEVFTLDRLKAELETGWETPKGEAIAGIGPLSASLASVTQSGGVHVWLRWPDDGGAPIRNRGNLPLHVDVRGLGGYVIAPPSVMASGRAYHWLRGMGPAEAAIAQAPAALVDVLRARKGSREHHPEQRGNQGQIAARTSQRAPPRRTDDPVESARRKWALSVLDRVLSELSGAREGQRGQELNRCGFYLGQLVGAGVLSRVIVEAGLEQAAADNGLAAKDGADRVRDTIERSVTAGEDQPRDMSDIGQLAGRRTGADRGAGWHPFADDEEGNIHSADVTSYGPLPPGSTDDPSFHPEENSATALGGTGAAGDGGGDVIAVEPDPERDRHCASLPQTDLGNAERFLHRFGRDFRFCPDLGWFRWDGQRWALLSEEKDKLPGEVMQAIYRTVRAIGQEAALVARSGVATMPQVHRHRLHLAMRLMADGLIDSPAELESVVGPREEEEDAPPRLDFIIKVKATGEVLLFSDTLRAHARASEGNGRLKAIGDLARNMAGILVAAGDFDVEREAINVRNGTIRIGTDGNKPAIRLCPHRREDLITKLADVVYDPKATCPDYDGFFARVQPDAADRRFLHQWAGLSATGDVSHHKMAFFWGKGRNGKSTWVDRVASILGDYAMTIGFDTFLEQQNKRKGSDATPDLARLPGVRMLRASEPEKGARLAEGLIKSVTGGEEITARHLNRGFFDFLPSFKFTAQGNYRPKIKGTDDGIWSRVRLVPWTVRIPDSEIDRALPDKLRAEHSGIFNRMMAGLIDLKMHGLVESENVREASRKYREASDALGRFLHDCTADKPDARTPSSDLKALFDAWCKASGVNEWTAQGFAAAMEDRGYDRITSNGVKWLDIETTLDVADIQAGNFGDGGGERDRPDGDAGGGDGGVGDGEPWRPPTGTDWSDDDWG